MRNVFRAAISFLALVTLVFGSAAAGFATVTGNEPIYVHSATCTPGGTATIQIHGKVDDPSADVSFDFANSADRNHGQHGTRFDRQHGRWVLEHRRAAESIDHHRS